MKKLEIKKRPSQMVSIRIPVDTLEQLKQLAEARNLGYQSLLKLYIGEGIRRDVPSLNKRTLLNETEDYLRKHLGDDKEIRTILGKIKKIAAAS